MMRVVHAYKIFKPEMEGGIPEVIDILARGLSAQGHENEIVVARSWGLASTETRDSVQIKRIASLGTLLSLPLAPTYPFRLHQAVKGADIVALHAPFPLADPVVAALPASTGLVVHWHSDIIRQKRSSAILAPLRRRMLERADAIITTHESILDHTEVLKPYSGKTVVIPYGINVEYWQTTTPADDQAIASLKRKHPTLFVAVGRLVTYKGFDVLLTAMTQVDGQLVICGDGPERGRLHALAAELGVADRVTFAGKVSIGEMKRYLKAATCFVFPSVTAAETFGIVQLEAMAMGLPVINTALTTTVPHVARHGQEALTVAPRNIGELQGAMQLMVHDNTLRQRLGAAGRERVELHYSNAHFVDRVLGYYVALCDRLKGL
jgi:rhamnosyl/mannosyltransferase